MTENLPSNSQVQEESFASRTQDVLRLYNSLIASSQGRLSEIRNYFTQIEKKPFWQKILDLRIIGIALFVTAFSLKCFSIGLADKILDTGEFVTIFIVGTAFLILGTYFNVRELQEGRKLIEKESEAQTTTLRASLGLMKTAK